MFVKLFGALMIVISCAGFGFSVNFRNKLKIKELSNLKYCLKFMENEMCISYKTLYEALKEAGKYASDINKHLFDELLKCKNNEENYSFNESLSEILYKPYALYNDKDIRALKGLHNIKNCENMEILKENFSILLSDLDERILNLNDTSKNKSISGKLAIYVGIIIVVFLM